MILQKELFKVLAKHCLDLVYLDISRCSITSEGFGEFHGLSDAEKVAEFKRRGMPIPEHLLGYLNKKED